MRVLTCLLLLAAMEKMPVAGTDEFFEAYEKGGEIEAMRALLKVHGHPAQPTPDWASASARPAGKP